MRADISDLVLLSGARPICGGSFLGACFTLGTSHGLAKPMKNALFVLDRHDPLVYLKGLLLTIERSALYFSRISRGDAHD